MAGDLVAPQQWPMAWCASATYVPAHHKSALLCARSSVRAPTCQVLAGLPVGNSLMGHSSALNVAKKKTLKRPCSRSQSGGQQGEHRRIAFRALVWPIKAVTAQFTVPRAFPMFGVTFRT